MNRTHARLAERRHHLVAQAAAQREALARRMEPWRGPLSLADRGVAAVRYAARHPGWLVGAVALLLVVLRPRRAAKWLARGWALRKLGQYLHRR